MKETILLIVSILCGTFLVFMLGYAAYHESANQRALEYSKEMAVINCLKPNNN